MKRIPIAQPTIGTREKKYVLECLKSTWISSSGLYIDRFEKKFAEIVGTKYATSTTNGTASLHLALLATDIGPGDEVIVPALTFVTTANVVRYVGAKPVFVDIHPATWNIDPQLIEKEITKKTKAIIPVHLYGYPADMPQIMAIAKKHKLLVIEDAAEAHGAMINNKVTGSIGHIGCFSFYGNKIATTGEGGMVTTNHKQLFERIAFLKNHGMSKTRPYYHPEIGYNYRMTNVQAAIGLAQLEQFKLFLRKRDQINATYRELFAAIPGITVQPKENNIKSVCWLFSLLITKDFSHTASEVLKYLKKNHVDARPFFYPLPLLPMYKSKKRFPTAERIAQEGINLPTFIDLSKNQQRYIAGLFKKLANL